MTPTSRDCSTRAVRRRLCPPCSPCSSRRQTSGVAGESCGRTRSLSVFSSLIFWKNIVHFGLSWSTDENYSHGFLVPLISLYFANMAAERGPLEGAWGRLVVWLATCWAGSMLVKLATVVVVVGALGDLAFIVAIARRCRGCWRASMCLKRYGFAIAFLVFMVPLPVALYATIASPLQLLVSRVASVLLNATGVPVLTEGNMMTLPGGVQMFVAEACSGMRQLTGFLALTAAVAYLSGRPIWYRAAVVGSAVPIAMTANVARVTLTGYIMYYVNPHFASGTFHTLEGLVMLGFGLSLLRAGCWVLDQIMAATAPDPPADPSTGRWTVGRPCAETAPEAWRSATSGRGRPAAPGIS